MTQYNASVRGYGGTSRSYVDERAGFIVKTYNHLFGAIVLFTLIEIALFSSGIAQSIALTMSRSWLLVLGGFMLVGWLASRTAHSARSLGAQYAALAAYVLAEAIVFVPLLFIADRVAPGAIKSAAVVTLLGFGGLTVVAFTSKKDFSFLGSFLRWGGISGPRRHRSWPYFRVPTRNLLQRPHGGLRGRGNPLRYLRSHA
ncbi:MAG: Bax inhibitor-1 family protein [Polyangiaceae bacterium]